MHAWLTTAATYVAQAAPRQPHGAATDSVVVDSPLPGGAASVVRFLLNSVPSWVQIGGLVVAAIVAALVIGLLVRRRGAIAAWVTAQSRAARIALALIALLLVAGAAAAGTATWNYTQHSNDFCTGCHVMGPAIQRFTDPSNAHAELSCHDCHQQPLSASIRQLYLWVAERPEEIGEHAPIENRVCETCHVTGDTATWQRIASTAGHRVHLESDSASLDDLQCVTCHGVEVHSFQPVDQTCGQSGCHSTSETGIVLGRMATQTVQHCATCHEFTAPVPALATRDSARGTLVPGLSQCMSCHEMRAVLADFDEARDPHGGTCGSCHNPHVQTTTAEAVTSCTGCHADWREEPFHVGASHRRVGEQCLTCHLPHQAKVDASSCQGCHEAVRNRSGLRPPVRFDTSAALRRSDTTSVTLLHAPAALLPSHATFPLPRSTPRRGGPFVADIDEDAIAPALHGATFQPSEPVARQVSVAVADTFPHARHTSLACIVCHETGAGGGRLTFEVPRGCDICHHQAPRQARCESCHQTEEYGRPLPATVTVTVAGHPPAPRNVDFLHARHGARSCIECHTTPVTLAVTPPKAQCTDCHAEHHVVGPSCASCHSLENPGRSHPTPEIAHLRCDACHERSTIEQLMPAREFCSTCHTAQRADHYAARECTACHFLAEPARFRSHLITAPPR